MPSAQADTFHARYLLVHHSHSLLTEEAGCGDEQTAATSAEQGDASRGTNPSMGCFVAVPVGVASAFTGRAGRRSAATPEPRQQNGGEATTPSGAGELFQHLDTAAHQLSASLCTGAFARCTPAERQQLHTLTRLMANAARGKTDFAHGLDTAAHQLAGSLVVGDFAGCTTQERMQLHMLALFLAEAGEQAQARTGRPRSLNGRERWEMPE